LASSPQGEPEAVHLPIEAQEEGVAPGADLPGECAQVTIEVPAAIATRRYFGSLTVSGEDSEDQFRIGMAP